MEIPETDVSTIRSLRYSIFSTARQKSTHFCDNSTVSSAKLSQTIKVIWTQISVFSLHSLFLEEEICQASALFFIQFETFEGAANCIHLQNDNCNDMPIKQMIRK